MLADGPINEVKALQGGTPILFSPTKAFLGAGDGLRVLVFCFVLFDFDLEFQGKA